MRLLDWRIIVSIATDVARYKDEVILGTGARSLCCFGLRSVDNRRSFLNWNRHCPRRCRQFGRHRTWTWTLSNTCEEWMTKELVKIHTISRFAPQQAHQEIRQLR